MDASLGVWLERQKSPGLQKRLHAPDLRWFSSVEHLYGSASHQTLASRSQFHRVKFLRPKPHRYDCHFPHVTILLNVRHEVGPVQSTDVAWTGPIFVD